MPSRSPSRGGTAGARAPSACRWTGRRRAWGEAGFRPVDPAVAKEFADKFPAPEKLYTVSELGGWDKLNDQLFDPDKGSIAKIYDAATG